MPNVQDRAHWMTTLIVSVVAASITGAFASYVLVTNAVARLEVQGIEAQRQLDNQQGQINALDGRTRLTNERIASVEAHYMDILRGIERIEKKVEAAR
jgi:hypothetical protein